MPSGISTFTDLFRAATGLPNQAPFPYQERFATQDGECPDVVHAPTGAGKTLTAILGWLWRRRYHPVPSARQATPRRLVYCLPMRTLVEQTGSEVKGWIGNVLKHSGDLAERTVAGLKWLSDPSPIVLKGATLDPSFMHLGEGPDRTSVV